MTYVVVEGCINCKHTDCVSVCPVDCFYEGENMLVIDPDECIDCGVCEPECPQESGHDPRILLSSYPSMRAAVMRAKASRDINCAFKLCSSFIFSNNERYDESALSLSADLFWDLTSCSFPKSSGGVRFFREGFINLPPV